MVIRLASCACLVVPAVVGCAPSLPQQAATYTSLGIEQSKQAYPPTHTSGSFFGRDEAHSLLVGWQGLADTIVTDVNNDYVHLVPASTVDVLPGSLGVARVASFDGQLNGGALPGAGRPRFLHVASTISRTKSGSPSPRAATNISPGHPLVGNTRSPVTLSMSPANELIDWMELFDDTWLISEVFPITYPRYPDREVRPNGLIERARQAGARLCLIYRENVPGEITAEFRGTIYEVSSGRLLAAVHASASAPDPGTEPPPPPDRVAGDRRHVDPRFVAHERFRELVRACVLEWVAEYEKHHGRRAIPDQSVTGKTRPNISAMLGGDRRR